MIGIGKSLFKSNIKAVSGAALDPSAQAFITAAGITDATQKSAVNQLVLNLKSANIWTKMKAIYPILGGSASTHKWNLKDPRDLDAAYRLTFATGWTHSSTGMTPNGTSAYADTFLIPNSSLTPNYNHYSVYVRTDQTLNAVPLGAYTDSSTINQLNISTNSGLIYYTGSISTELLSALTDSKGFFIGTTRANNDRKTFKNGIQQKSLTTIVNTSYSSFKMYLGARNLAGSANSYTTQQISFSSIGDGLTDTETSNLYTSIQTYQTTLSRNV
jgi:hypothetical protein